MLTLLPKNNTPPSITTNLSNTTIAQNQTLTLTIGVSGSDLTYVWYKDNQIISGSSTATLTINNVAASYNNSTFKVVVSNNLGTVTSNVITLTVTDFLGVKILKTSPSVTIDGVKDDVWAYSNEYTLKNKILTVDNDADLSAKVNVLYGADALYVFYTVTDNQKRASSTNFWENDGVELYIDGNNDKATSYDANDFQYVIRYDASKIEEGHSKSVTGIVAKSTQNTTGYIVEVSIPWTLIGITPTAGKSMGIDFHANDSDLSLRDGKIAWFATQDNSYSDPSSFGLGRLENTVVTSIDAGQEQLQCSVFPNPTKGNLQVQNFDGDFSFVIIDPMGKALQTGTSHSVITTEHLAAGIYGLFIQNDSRKVFVNFVKE